MLATLQAHPHPPTDELVQCSYSHDSPQHLTADSYDDALVRTKEIDTRWRWCSLARWCVIILLKVTSSRYCIHSTMFWPHSVEMSLCVACTMSSSSINEYRYQHITPIKHSKQSHQQQLQWSLADVIENTKMSQSQIR